MLKELEPLVSQYARSRQVLFDNVAPLNDEQVDECFPGRDWSIKDTCIHVSANEKLMTRLVQDIAQGTTNALPAEFDNETFNRESVAAGRSKNMAQIRADLDESYKHIISVLETITPKGLTRRGMHPAAGDSDVKEFFLAMYAHHEIHCRDVVEHSRRLRKGS